MVAVVVVALRVVLELSLDLVAVVLQDRSLDTSIASFSVSPEQYFRFVPLIFYSSDIIMSLFILFVIN